MNHDMAFFVMLARRGSFTNTGRDLGLSASAVSRRLAQLEDRLGVRLLNRTTRRVSLTSEGELYFNEAVRILGEIETLEQNVIRAQDTLTGILRVNSTLRFGRTYVANALSTFKTRYPEVEAQLILTDTPLNLVEEGIDIGIQFGPPPDSQMVIHRLLSNRRFLCAAPSYLEKHGTQVTLNDLKMHDCIVLRQDRDVYNYWRFDATGDEIPSVRVTGALSTNDGEVGLDWVLAGHGVMLRSEWDIAEHVRSGRLQIVLPKYAQTAHVSAVYQDRLDLSAKVLAFINELSSLLEEVEKRKPLRLPDDQG